MADSQTNQQISLVEYAGTVWCPTCGNRDTSDGLFFGTDGDQSWWYCVWCYDSEQRVSTEQLRAEHDSLDVPEARIQWIQGRINEATEALTALSKMITQHRYDKDDGVW